MFTPVVGRAADKEEMHIVLEYKKGDAWGPYTAPRANRQDAKKNIVIPITIHAKNLPLILNFVYDWR